MPYPNTYDLTVLVNHYKDTRKNYWDSYSGYLADTFNYYVRDALQTRAAKEKMCAEILEKVAIANAAQAGAEIEKWTETLVYLDKMFRQEKENTGMSQLLLALSSRILSAISSSPDSDTARLLQIEKLKAATPSTEVKAESKEPVVAAPTSDLAEQNLIACACLGDAAAQTAKLFNEKRKNQAYFKTDYFKDVIKPSGTYESYEQFETIYLEKIWKEINAKTPAAPVVDAAAPTATPTPVVTAEAPEPVKPAVVVEESKAPAVDAPATPKAVSPKNEKKDEPAFEPIVKTVQPFTFFIGPKKEANAFVAGKSYADAVKNEQTPYTAAMSFRKRPGVVHRPRPPGKALFQESQDKVDALENSSKPRRRRV